MIEYRAAGTIWAQSALSGPTSRTGPEAIPAGQVVSERGFEPLRPVRGTRPST